MVNDEVLEETKRMIRSTISLAQYYRDNVEDVDLNSYRRQPCPLHAENISSFTYYPNTDTFYCFGCKKGGDVIAFNYYLMKLEDPSINYVQALLKLANMYGIKVRGLFKEKQTFETIVKRDQEKRNRKQLEIKAEYPIKVLENRLEELLMRLKEKDLDLFFKYASMKDMAKDLGLCEEKERELYNRLMGEIEQYIN